MMNSIPPCSLALQVNPQFYAFRWITLLLTQEFSFPDSLRLWDTLLSDPAGRTDCLLRLCVAMLLNVREELMQVGCVCVLRAGAARAGWLATYRGEVAGETVLVAACCQAKMLLVCMWTGHGHVTTSTGHHESRLSSQES